MGMDKIETIACYRVTRFGYCFHVWTNQTVSGIVKSESGGEPLVGATVKVKETNTGGITDIDGRYTIQANLGQTLIVSYIGYRTKEVKVERTIRIDILLQEDNEMLDEVVVVGYGTMKRSDLTRFRSQRDGVTN